MPEHSCSQRACVTTPKKIPSKYIISYYMGVGQTSFSSRFILLACARGLVLCMNGLFKAKDPTLIILNIFVVNGTVRERERRFTQNSPALLSFNVFRGTHHCNAANPRGIAQNRYRQRQDAGKVLTFLPTPISHCFEWARLFVVNFRHWLVEVFTSGDVLLPNIVMFLGCINLLSIPVGRLLLVRVYFGDYDQVYECQTSIAHLLSRFDVLKRQICPLNTICLKSITLIPSNSVFLQPKWRYNDWIFVLPFLV